MGKPSAASEDIAARHIEGTLEAVGMSQYDVFDGKFNVTIGDDDTEFTGSVKIIKSYNAGTTWHTCSRDSAGTPAVFTAPATVLLEEPEAGVLYAVEVTALSDGEVYYRISK